MLHYFALEIGLRPVLVDINQRVSPRTERSLSALPLRWRLPLTRLVPEPEPEPIAAADRPADLRDLGGGRARDRDR